MELLIRIYSTFRATAADVGEAFCTPPATADDSACAATHELAREAATVKLQDRWNHFCRELILASATGPAQTADGIVLPRAHASPSAALDALRATFTGRAKKHRYWEPKWFDPLESIDASQRLAIPNVATVSAALGATPAPLDDLRAARNFFAHRGRRAGQAIYAAAGLRSTADVHAYLTAPELGGALRFEAWVLTLQSMAHAAVYA